MEPKGLEIGKYINWVLSDLFGGKVYPSIAPVDAKAPFAVYVRENVSRTGDKDGISEEVVTFSISIIAESYSKAVELAVLTDDLFAPEANLESSAESYYIGDNLYEQVLTYSLTTR